MYRQQMLLDNADLAHTGGPCLLAQISKLMIVPFVCTVEALFFGKKMTLPIIIAAAIVVSGVAVVCALHPPSPSKVPCWLPAGCRFPLTLPVCRATMEHYRLPYCCCPCSSS